MLKLVRFFIFGCFVFTIDAQETTLYTPLFNSSAPNGSPTNSNLEDSNTSADTDYSDKTATPFSESPDVEDTPADTEATCADNPWTDGPGGETICPFWRCRINAITITWSIFISNIEPKAARTLSDLYLMILTSNDKFYLDFKYWLTAVLDQSGRGEVYDKLLSTIENLLENFATNGAINVTPSLMNAVKVDLRGELLMDTLVKGALKGNFESTVGDADLARYFLLVIERYAVTNQGEIANKYAAQYNTVYESGESLTTVTGSSWTQAETKEYSETEADFGNNTQTTLVTPSSFKRHGGYHKHSENRKNHHETTHRKRNGKHGEHLDNRYDKHASRHHGEKRKNRDHGKSHQNRHHEHKSRHGELHIESLRHRHGEESHHGKEHENRHGRHHDKGHEARHGDRDAKHGGRHAQKREESRHL